MRSCHGKAVPPMVCCWRMTARPASGAVARPRRSSSAMSVLLPAPGPPVMTNRCPTLMVTSCSRFDERVIALGRDVLDRARLGDLVEGDQGFQHALQMLDRHHVGA